MAQVEEIATLLERLGSTDDEIAEIWQEEDDDHTWAVAYDEDAIVSIKLNEAQEKLVFSIELGTPFESNRLQLYETLLSYNLLGEDTGGIKMALSDGEVVQLFELHIANFPSLDELQWALTNFVSKAYLWRECVTSCEPAFVKQMISPNMWV